MKHDELLPDKEKAFAYINAVLDIKAPVVYDESIALIVDEIEKTAMGAIQELYQLSVTGTGTGWTTLETPLLDTDGAPVYQVGSIGSDTSITLSSNYAGSTASGEDYQLVSDFSANYGFPLPTQGMSDSADWLARTINLIDAKIKELHP